MVTKTYTTKIDVELSCVGTPDYIVRLDDKVVECSGTYELAAGPHRLEINHINKKPTDPDTAIIINSISFNGIASPKFIWRGVYRPDYPEPWASSQHNLAQELTNTGYLGWNGVWCLEFTAPIFTWIHQVEDLGWIYS